MASIAVRGAWFEMLLIMWDSPIRGALEIQKKDLENLWGISRSETAQILLEIRSKRIGYVEEFPDKFLVISRRMFREYFVKETDRLRKRRHPIPTILKEYFQKISNHFPENFQSYSSSSSSVSLKKTSKESMCVFSLPDWFPKDTWTLFLDHRKKVKAPITDRAYPSFVAKFEKLNAAGWPPGRVVEVMVEKGWRWFKPEWVEGRQQQPAAPMESPMSRQKASDILKRWKEEE